MATQQSNAVSISGGNATFTNLSVTNLTYTSQGTISSGSEIQTKPKVNGTVQSGYAVEYFTGSKNWGGTDLDTYTKNTSISSSKTILEVQVLIKNNSTNEVHPLGVVMQGYNLPVGGQNGRHADYKIYVSGGTWNISVKEFGQYISDNNNYTEMNLSKDNWTNTTVIMKVSYY
jgi:hypothetical protein